MALEKPTVLYVDDVPMNLKLFEATFRNDFVLIDQQTKQLLYDNEEDKYLESLGLGFDVTKPLIIKVDVLARGSNEEEIKENIGCLGLLIQYKNYPNKKVKLQM